MCLKNYWADQFTAILNKKGSNLKVCSPTLIHQQRVKGKQSEYKIIINCVRLQSKHCLCTTVESSNCWLLNGHLTSIADCFEFVGVQHHTNEMRQLHCQLRSLMSQSAISKFNSSLLAKGGRDGGWGGGGIKGGSIKCLPVERAPWVATDKLFPSLGLELWLKFFFLLKLNLRSERNHPKTFGIISTGILLNVTLSKQSLLYSVIVVVNIVDYNLF